MNKIVKIVKSCKKETIVNTCKYFLLLSSTYFIYIQILYLPFTGNLPLLVSGKYFVPLTGMVTGKKILTIYW